MSLSIAPALLALLRAPESFLAVWTGTHWKEWWCSSSAPAVWTGPLPALATGLAWRRIAPGVEWSELRLAGSGEAARIRVIVARIDPAMVRFRLDTAFSQKGTRPLWSIARSPRDALVAINAGQFPRTHPWGWVVLGGRQYQPPGVGPLSVGIAFDSSGALRWIAADSLRSRRATTGTAEGFQSYPRLLVEGAVPAAIRSEGQGVDLTHRDARAALGQTADGKVLLVLTRFDGAGGVLDFLPFGVTVPEMAAIMGALGARNAVMLDGGISSQLLIRDQNGHHRWRGLRAVPLGLVITRR